MQRMRKRRKSNLIRFFCDGRKFRRQCAETLKDDNFVQINTTSRCVNHVCTLPPKLSSLKKKIGSGSIFCVFASVACILIGKDGEYKKNGKTHAKILDSVCNGLKSCLFEHSSCCGWVINVRL